MSNQSKRLEPDVFTAMNLYLKYRWSHKVGGEFLKVRSNLLKKLRAYDDNQRQQFVADVDVFLDNNKEVIRQAKLDEEAGRKREHEAEKRNMDETLKKAKELI